jgi:benzaldehyde dehydrogenase (NAD)
MKPTGILTALRTGAYLLGIALARLLAGMVHVNDQTDLPQCPMGGLGHSGNGSRFGGLNSRDEFTEWQWLTVSGSAALYPT